MSRIQDFLYRKETGDLGNSLSAKPRTDWDAIRMALLEAEQPAVAGNATPATAPANATPATPPPATPAQSTPAPATTATPPAATPATPAPAPVATPAPTATAATPPADDKGDMKKKIDSMFKAKSFAEDILAPGGRNAIRHKLKGEFPNLDFQNENFRKAFIEANEKFGEAAEEAASKFSEALKAYKKALYELAGIDGDDKDVMVAESANRPNRALVEASDRTKANLEGILAYVNGVEVNQGRKGKKPSLKKFGFFPVPNWAGFDSHIGDIGSAGDGGAGGGDGGGAG